MDFGSERQTYDIGFTEPWLLGIPLSAGFNIYYWERQRDTYEWSQKGGRLRFGYPLDEIWPDLFLAQNAYMGVTFRYEKVDVYNLSADASGLIVAERGERTVSSVLLALTRNTVDDKNDPSVGTLASFSTEYAGLGGDDKFVKVMGDFTYHRPMPAKTVLSLHGNVSYASSFTGDDLPIYERFFAGGATTIRGYEERSVGPKDERGEDLGGDKRMVFNIEYKFPLYNPLNLKGVVFFDAGNVFGRDEDFDITSFKKGAGFGLRFMSPFGPLKLDWGYALDADEEEPSSQWHFAVGSYF
jgi:outer membrane protein insertion porin family